MRIGGIAVVALIAAYLGCVAQPVTASEHQWLLMSRHGECVEMGSLRRKIPDLGEINDPYSFIRLMRQNGHEVISNEISGAKGKAVEVKVPEKDLFLIFVTPEMCHPSGVR
jgi:hypothetical protein